MENIKDKYYNLIYKNKIPDVFCNIPELSYTQKYNILNNLLQKYTSLCVSHALCEYEISYINNNRVNLEIIYSTLKKFCEILKNKNY